MTNEEKQTNYETLSHIDKVRNNIGKIINILLCRSQEHDASKLVDPELATFVEMTPKLAGSTYGSEEYKGFLERMKPALDHHYARNLHHPEHYKDGINDMTLIDLMEMLSDWKAATMRHNDGNIRKSIELNAKRFNMDNQLTRIMENTVKQLEW